METIIRVTTPSIKVTFKIIDVSTITKAYLTIDQYSKTIIEKDITQAQKGEDCLIWTLTQEETKKIQKNRFLDIQCKYKLQNGFVGASKMYEVTPYDILKEDVI